ncbi:hypothetical protein RclHR1_00130052 [Rhizophagus clarus]|uniref:Uncharacterized protein n=1 Tax=Rhizophagus clarus TaxID=94130 RepID=A0A2Z6QPG9_9GLOM|nr:hypothetical protein RclHR1_00130052 [Rhizophagus clarus]GES87529.1 hypothetical protein RCL_jg26418.t1 [Rhizophagus clarus]
MRFNHFLLFLITFSVVALAAVPGTNTPNTQCVMRPISSSCNEICACDANCKSVPLPGSGTNEFVCDGTCPCEEENLAPPETPINPPENPPTESGPANPSGNPPFENPPIEPGPVCVPPAC